ncbi:MAG: guanylate kinase [Rikenellaceae bacterium]|nr:guanylate kinase [Rikenellaceae bacterium]MDE7355417.1 guanylate kinase [Rikenellaceae bacterium]
MNKVVIFSAPSGAGKSTIVNRLLELFPQLEFSVSATSRAPRGDEQEGREYYFLSAEEFARRVDSGDFLEWEEVYSGSRYGTLRSELERIWHKGNVATFDIDVKGGLNIKRLLGQRAMSVFIMPPSIDELRRRLERRGTDTPESIDKRVAKAESEISFASHYDKVIVNDNLDQALAEAAEAVGSFITMP